MNRVPTQPQLFSHRLLAGVFQPLSRQRLKQSSKSAVGLGPRQLHHPHAMLAALAARRLGMHDRLVLTGIQMPPLALRLMIVERTAGSAFGTGPVQFVLVGQIDVDLALLQLELHALHLPGSLDTQDAAIQFAILHTEIFP